MKIKDIFYYAQGNIRYELFYSKFKSLLPKHIEQQITYRINSMDVVCYVEGQCQMCGCKTTALQMCNKPCDKPCYPKMLSKKLWHLVTTTDCVIPKKLIGDYFEIRKNWIIDTRNLKFIKK